MKDLFDKNEVNTGRQVEFDYMKGIFMLLIYLIHAFQATQSPESGLVSGIYIVNSMLGAAIFILVMGFGTAYSRRATPLGYCKDGIKLVLYQYLDNIAYVIALLLPYLFVRSSLEKADTDVLKLFVTVYIQYVNIFFIAGIIYLVLALLKKLNASIIVYVVIATVVSIAAPFIYGTPVNIPVIGYIVKLFIGEGMHVSFTPLYFLPYALYGAAIGRIYRHIKNKRKFYLSIMPICLAVIIVWWVLTFLRFGTDFAEMRAVMGQTYVCPNLWHTIASMAHILLLAAIIYFICGDNNKPKNPVSKQLLYYSKHISKYYALHILTYFVIFGFHKYRPFASWQCWIIMIIGMFVTELMVRGWNKFYDSIRSRRSIIKKARNSA